MNIIHSDDKHVVFEDRPTWVYYACGVLWPIAGLAGYFLWKISPQFAMNWAFFPALLLCTCLLVTMPHWVVSFDQTKKKILVRRMWSGITRESVYAFRQVAAIKQEQERDQQVTYRPLLLLRDGVSQPLGNWTPNRAKCDETAEAVYAVLAEHLPDDDVVAGAEAKAKVHRTRQTIKIYLAAGGALGLILTANFVLSIIDREADRRARFEAYQQRIQHQAEQEQRTRRP